MQARAATLADIERIRALTDAPEGIEADLPFWVVADQAGAVVGCLRVYAGRVGMLEHMTLAPELRKREKVEAFKVMTGWAMTLLRVTGAAVVQSFVPKELDGYRKVIERYWGCEVMSEGWMMAKVL